MVSTISGNPPAQPVQSQVALPIPVAQANTTLTTSQTSSANTPVNISDGSNQVQFEQKLNDALKNSGYKAEVDTSDPSETVVRIVDNVTGKLVVQMPSANALAIAEAMHKGLLTQNPVVSGSLVDESA